MEHPKYSPEEQEWANALVKRLSTEFPNAHIRADTEHFIYEVTESGGEHMEVHTPKWQKIPIKNPDDSITYVNTEDIIRSRLTK